MRQPTPRLFKVLCNAEEHAAKMGSTHIGTEHVLLGLAQEQSGPHAEAFKKLGLTPEQIKDGVMEILGYDTSR